MSSKITTIATLSLALLAGCSDDPASQTSRKLRRAFGDDAKGIEVRVEGSTATLSGTVSERSTQELAEEVARSVPGVTSVENRISGPQSKGLGKLRDEALDATLEMAVKHAIVRDVGSGTAQALEVEACDGVVSLRGKVLDRDTAKRVREAAERADGARRVIDLIDVVT
jgi:osmotically-inducible protein OsmY